MAAPPLKTPRTCSQCGNNGHNARTCTDITTTATPHGGGCGGGFMLFGVHVTTSSDGFQCGPGFRKSMSMNNLSQYDHHLQLMPNDSPGDGDGDGDSGYVSDDAVHASSSPCRNRERKRGVPWTEDEHKLFLVGLKKVGKGDWRGISRNFVKTRTPTQVASHAQKYFLRRTNFNRRRRRSSLFDITTDEVTNSSNEDQQFNQDSTSQSKASLSTTPPTNQNMKVKMNITTTFPNPFTPTISPTCSKLSPPPIPIPPSSKMANLNLNKSPTSSSTSTKSSRDRESEPLLSLKLSSAPSDEESMSRSSGFAGFNGNGDSMISVA